MRGILMDKDFQNVWQECVDRIVSERGNLVKNYLDEVTGENYMFSTRRVVPSAWATIPVQLDYKLFADMRIEKEGKIVKNIQGIDLGGPARNLISELSLSLAIPRERQTIWEIKYASQNSKSISNFVERAYVEANELKGIKVTRSD